MTPIINKIYRWCFWNLISRVFVFIVLRPKFKFRRTSASQKLPRAPFIIVANHGTFFDPWLVGGYSPYPFAIMCNDDAFTGSSFSKWYLEGIGAFPKKKGASDFKATKRTLAELKAGYPVCLFPEGQTTWDGTTQLMYKGIEKIIKKSGCPLVIVHMQGNFLSKPWWAYSQRKGRVFLTFSVVSPNELSALSDDEVFAHVRSTLAQNDITDPVLREISFAGTNLALGLERCVWECMHCGAEDTHLTKGNNCTCTACGQVIVIDSHCHFTNGDGSASKFSHLVEWMSHLKKSVLSRIQNADESTILCFSTGVTLSIFNAPVWVDANVVGMLQLTPTTLFLVVAGKEHLRIAVSEIKLCVIQKKDICEIETEKDKFRFCFSYKSPMKWVYFIRYLKGYEKNEAAGYI
jgi:1-acyl-sn-glycerol-3-phosphate acyltransferase